jgi:hypothetical protein
LNRDSVSIAIENTEADDEPIAPKDSRRIS